MNISIQYFFLKKERNLAVSDHCLQNQLKFRNAVVPY